MTENPQAEANQRTVQDVFRLWIDPEVEERQHAITTMATSLSSLAGILVWSVPASGTGIMYVAPQTDADAPLL